MAASNATAFRDSFSAETCASFQKQFGSIYGDWRNRLFQRLTLIAQRNVPYSAKYGIGTGCGLAIVVVFVASLFGAIAESAGAKGAAGFFTGIGAIATVVVPIVAVIWMNRSQHAKAVNAQLSSLHERQKALEEAIGYVEA